MGSPWVIAVEGVLLVWCWWYQWQQELRNNSAMRLAVGHAKGER
ncbi:hypothetical protein [Moorena producens]|nr:hypothetical protein [Moorena producens]